VSVVGHRRGVHVHLIDEIIEGHGRLTATNGAGAAAGPRSVTGSSSGGPTTDGGSAATRG
jgi:hypothetical protein